MPGGVCAVLDYEVEWMAEYVAEMTTRLAFGNGAASAAFRKFISQILTSTRLPSTTILLGMNYLAKRINMMNASGPRSKMSDGQVWRMLTVALVLGSKFLDDNTFQNKSWAEVSGIKVQELNTLENEWMDAIDWHLYVNLDNSADYKAWLQSWKDWCGNKKTQQAMAGRERLALVPAIETHVARPRNVQPYSPYSPTSYQEQVAEYERLTRMKPNEPMPQQQNYRPREPSWSSYQPVWNPPLTPPDSGYGTPEYLNSATSVNSQYNDWFNQQATNRAFVNNTYSRQLQYQQPPNHNAYHSRNPSNYPSYNFYGHNIWEHNIADCNCSDCGAQAFHKQQPYFSMAHSHSFGQPVMG